MLRDFEQEDRRPEESTDPQGDDLGPGPFDPEPESVVLNDPHAIELLAVDIGNELQVLVPKFSALYEQWRRQVRGVHFPIEDLFACFINYLITDQLLPDEEEFQTIDEWIHRKTGDPWQAARLGPREGPTFNGGQYKGMTDDEWSEKLWGRS